MILKSVLNVVLLYSSFYSGFLQLSGGKLQLIDVAQYMRTRNGKHMQNKAFLLVSVCIVENWFGSYTHAVTARCETKLILVPSFCGPNWLQRTHSEL